MTANVDSSSIKTRNTVADTSLYPSPPFHRHTVWAALDLSAWITIWEADPLELTLSSAPAAVANETLHCQNKVWLTHFNYASSSSFERLPVEMYTRKHPYIKTKTVTNKPQARTTLDIFSLSVSVCWEVLHLPTCHSDNMINVCKGQRSQFGPQLLQLCVCY